MSPLIYGLVVTFFGLVIVFIVLIALWGILAAMRVFFSEKKKQQRNQNGMQNEFTSALIEIAATQTEKEDMASDEVAAVIFAAIAVCADNKSNLVFTKINRVSESTPIWNQIGRHEQMLNRF